MDILRFITAGSVDDGKSTLIGRLLYDSKSILADQLEAIEKTSKQRNHEGVDLALLTDGLRAEREQGITIDVAYRYFSTPNRKFIIADAPGHVQYTRNMITGASNVSLMVVLIDARQGVVEQTKRHSIIASLLQIKHVVVAINKMDLVNYNEDVYNNIVIDYSVIAKQLKLEQVTYIPLSALKGDNIVDVSESMPWYNGTTLLNYLETVDVSKDENLDITRFQVQLVLRPQAPHLHDYRGYAGKISSGIYKKGDAVKVLPSGITTTIEKIEFAGQEVEEAFAPQSIVLLLKDDIDISRGDSIIKLEDAVEPTTEKEALLCWLDEKPLIAGNKYILQHQNKKVRAIIKNVAYKLDVNSLTQQPIEGSITLNEIVQATVKTAAPIVADAYAKLSNSGSAILIDETSNSTVAAVLFN